jgi:hypothetical protein
MNDPGIFVLGIAVTLVVGTAMSLLVWGAILDGRDERERRRRNSDRDERTLAVLETARSKSSGGHWPAA